MAWRRVCVCVCVCAVTLQETSGSFYSRKQTFPFTTRPSVVNESFVINFFHIIVDEAVNYAVADICHGNFSAFIVAYNKFSIVAVSVFSFVQIYEKIIEIFLEIILKIVQFICGFFAFPKCAPASPNIF